MSLEKHVVRAKRIVDQAFEAHPGTIEEAKAALVNAVAVELNSWENALSHESNNRDCYRTESAALLQFLTDVKSVVIKNGGEAGDNVRDLAGAVDELIKSKSQATVNQSHTHVHHHWHQPGIIEQVGDVLRAELGDKIVETALQNQISVNLSSDLETSLFSTQNARRQGESD